MNIVKNTAFCCNQNVKFSATEYTETPFRDRKVNFWGPLPQHEGEHPSPYPFLLFLHGVKYLIWLYF